MGADSKIEWTTHTFNPWRGCTKVSEGCRNCYADSMSKRNPGTLGVWGPNGTRVVASESMWKEPVKWNREAACNCHRRSDLYERHLHSCPQAKRPRVFCASLADVFEDWSGLMSASDGGILHVCNECGAWRTMEKMCHGPTAHFALTMQDVRNRLFALIDATPNLDWLLLTKRPENIERMMPATCDFCSGFQRLRDTDRCTCGGSESKNPRPNVWLGTSVENQAAADERIPHLLQVPASVRFLSCEPLLGPVDLRPWLSELQWVIVGGESGKVTRPMHPAWARDLRDQCVATGVPFHFKQWGEFAYYEVRPTETGVQIVPPLPVNSFRGLQLVENGLTRPLAGNESTAEVFAPGNLLAVRSGKSASGRLLDGREWNEFPTTEVRRCPSAS